MIRHIFFSILNVRNFVSFVRALILTHLYFPTYCWRKFSIENLFKTRMWAAVGCWYRMKKIAMTFALFSTKMSQISYAFRALVASPNKTRFCINIT